MSKWITKRLDCLEAAVKTAAFGGDYIIKINNATVEVTRIISPGKYSETVTEHASPYEAVAAAEAFILKRRLNLIPHCRFDNIAELYPEALSAFEHYSPIKGLLSPYYGREDISISQFELRHILIYRHAAALVYGTDHNAYVSGEHPDAEWFEAIMQPDDRAASQIALLTLVLSREMHKSGNSEI